MGVGAGGAGTLPTGMAESIATLNELPTTGEDVLLSVSPAGRCRKDHQDHEGQQRMAGRRARDRDREGRYVVGQIGDDGSTDGAVAATRMTQRRHQADDQGVEVSGFRDESDHVHAHGR